MTDTKGADAPQIRTVADMMKALEDEISLIKSGQMDLGTARVLAKFRNLEIQAAQLIIHHNRIKRQGGNKAGNMTYEMTTGREIPILTAGEEKPRPAGVPDPAANEKKTASG